MKGCATSHGQRFPRMVGHHEDRVVERRFVPPPSRPLFRRRCPGSRHGPRTGPNMLRPMIVAPIPTSAAATTSSSSPMSASSEDPLPELSVPEFPSVSYFPMFRELDLFYFSA